MRMEEERRMKNEVKTIYTVLEKKKPSNSLSLSLFKNNNIQNEQTSYFSIVVLCVMA